MTILVTGATGTVGRHVVEQLNTKGVTVRALSRNPEKANLPEGVEVVAGDLTKPESLRYALEGINGLYLILSSDQGDSLQTEPRMIGMAKEAGVQRIVVLMDYEGNPVENAVRDSGMEWTLLKPVEFMGNVLDDWQASIREGGVVRSPFANARSARVHEADIAAAAVAALTEEGHAGQSYILTGPEVKSRAEVVQQIADAIGRDIEFVELSEEEARQEWREQGYEEGDIDFFIEMGKNPPEIGHTVVPTVEQVTGKPARTFAQWLEENKQYFL
nr:NAD(P)H-binding protein [Paenibacillus senegalensis]